MTAMTINAEFVTEKWTTNPAPDITGLLHAVLQGKYITDDFKGDAEGSLTMVPFGETAEEEGNKRLANSHFDGQQIFRGSVGGKTGTFTAKDSGYIRNGSLEGEWEIIPETATGELVGITGKSKYNITLGQGGANARPMTMEIVLP